MVQLSGESSADGKEKTPKSGFEVSTQSPRLRVIRGIIIGLIFAILGLVFGILGLVFGGGFSFISSSNTHSLFFCIAGLIALGIALFLDIYQGKESVRGYIIFDIITGSVGYIILGCWLIFVGYPVWLALSVATIFSSVVIVILLIAGLFIVKSPLAYTVEEKELKRNHVLLILLIIFITLLSAAAFALAHFYQ